MTGVKPDATPDRSAPNAGAGAGMTIRTQELERENRRLRRIWMGTLVSVALLLGLATALVIVAARHGLPGTVADVVEARQFLLRDRNGAVRGTWSAADEAPSAFRCRRPGSKAGLSLSVLGGGASRDHRARQRRALPRGAGAASRSDGEPAVRR